MSDYNALRVLQGSTLEYCHELRYLQMCTEKLAKFYLSRQAGDQRQPNVHPRLTVFLRATRYDQKMHRRLRYSRNQYLACLRDILPFAVALEELYPVGSNDRPNTEYPWERGDDVFCPCEYDYPELNPDDGRVRQFRFLLDKCFEMLANED